MVALRRGECVLVYDFDGREHEIDLVICSELVRPEHILRLRRDGGGLICTTVYAPLADKLGLMFLAELFAKVDGELFAKLAPTDIPYDTKSAFSLTINHRRTFTGITDEDRALTISKLAELLKRQSDTGKNLLDEFGRDFRTPGHVQLLRTADGLLDVRTGHTELATALMLFAGLTPSATVCEMLSDSGGALSKRDAKRYAAKNRLVFLEGSEIVEEWRRWSP